MQPFYINYQLTYRKFIAVLSLLFVICDTIICPTFASFITNAYDVELPWFSTVFQNSKRNKTLDCSCGDISDHENDRPYPWQVLIYASNSTVQSDKIPDRICSGTIVNDRIILTAASCVINLPKKVEIPNITWFYTQKYEYLYPHIHIALVKSKQFLLKEVQPNQTLKVEKIEFHQFFAFQQMLFRKPDLDIVIVHLKERLRFNKRVFPLCLATQYLNTELVDVNVISSGWKVYAEEDKTVTPSVTNVVFQFASLPKQHICPRIHCRVSLRRFPMYVSESFICTGATPLLDTTALHLDGAAVMTKSASSPTQYVMLGIHSLNYYLTFESNPAVSLESNVSGYLAKIEEVSSLPEIQAGWCRHQPMDEYTKRTGDCNKNFLVPFEKLTEQWAKVTSHVRKINFLPETTCVCGVLNSKSHGRIQGGADAKAYEYGWQVQLIVLHRGLWSTCGGTIINDKVILTAGHCVRRMVEDEFKIKIAELVDPSNVTVRIIRHSGFTYEDSMSRDLAVELINVHLKFKETLEKAENYDMALLILKERLDFQNYKGKLSPVCLPETDEILPLDDRKDAITLGWGKTDFNINESGAKVLQELNVTISSKKKCAQLLNTIRQKLAATGEKPSPVDLTNIVCAGTGNNIRKYKDLLQGDSGGPLIVPLLQGNNSNSYSNPYIQVGIVSAGNLSLLLALAKRGIYPPSIVKYISVSDILPFIDYYSFAADAKWCRRG